MYMGNVEIIVTSELINAQMQCNNARTHTRNRRTANQRQAEKSTNRCCYGYTHTHAPKHKHRFAQTPLAKPL